MDPSNKPGLFGTIPRVLPGMQKQEVPADAASDIDVEIIDFAMLRKST